MGVADLIKKFDTTATETSDNINIKIFQPDQVSALAKSGLKVNGGSENSSPKKNKVKAVGLATGSRTVFVSESTNDIEPKVKQEKVTKEPKEVVVVVVEEEEAVAEEPNVEQQEETTEEPKAEQKEITEEPKATENEEISEETKATEIEEATEEPKIEAEEVVVVKEEEVIEAPVDKSEEISINEEVADNSAIINESSDSLKEASSNAANLSQEELVAPTTPVQKPKGKSNLRQEQKEEEQEEEQQKENIISPNETDSTSSPSSSTQYLESTKNIPKPSLDTRLGRDDPFTFGTRYLPEDENAIWDFNSWDHFKFTQEDIDMAESKIKLQKEVTDKEKYLDDNAYKHWDNFYSQHKENFFKDRKWLPIEFPILKEVVEPYYGPVKILEVGCGVGNTFNCILRDNANEKLEIHALDYSYTAIDLIKENEFYQQENAKGIAFADRWDICDSENLPVEPNSVDLIIMIFVFSALEPKQWEQTIQNCSKLLKKGGKILFRDYGRYDLAQVRFKGEKLLQENFYIRGDGTRVYFFTEEEINDIFTKGDQFNKVKIGIDRRLLVNRKKKIKMYRQWVQAVFEKN
ncbi:S-adenosyl-L-methionine-dependent methyltransferase [Hanseniaspora valbyensis NRRL Y-1626]|uniref:S-adenosyl-L-methionine-dependent methyltransferase n=1 Tax=Hanseniaspora valbyensis NRRL Y-1626 TaxID=766949 RepID=A0A1B7THB4_9ASCO|nr:S-adenosyl-L-methionine-dependent methyltransferase [Hanseniaspora valbyensis NRRL Y-1626]